MKFDRVSDVLSAYQELESPSFLQGMLMGLMCGDNSIKESVWIKKILEEADVKSIKESFLVVLHDLFLETDKTLNGSGFEIELCLPDDNEDLNFRTAMLGQFCEGFLYGMGLVGHSEQTLKGDVAELFIDFGNISAIDITDLEHADEDDESSFMQLVEYVKIGVMTINEELNPVEGSPIELATPPTSTLH
ncbi:MAG TPA: YecA family protein [Thiomicrospira sp.]|nr:YecA family protein [Thiomicrospira sp.]